MHQIFKIHSAILNPSIKLLFTDLSTAESDLRVSARFGNFLDLISVDFTVPDHIQLASGKKKSRGISPNYADCYIITINSKLPANLTANDVEYTDQYPFHIILRVDRQSNLLEIATNMQHPYFRMHMVLMTRLNNKLKPSLQNTEYYLANPNEVFQPYATWMKAVDDGLRKRFNISSEPFSQYIKEDFSNNALIAYKAFEEDRILPHSFKALLPSPSLEQKIKKELLTMFKKVFSTSDSSADFNAKLQSNFFSRTEHVTVTEADKIIKAAQSDWLRKNQSHIRNMKSIFQSPLFVPMSMIASSIMQTEIPEQLAKFSFLKSTENSQKKLVLSIGSGDCFYEAILQKKYCNEWDLFAIEPLLSANKDKNWPAERTFNMRFESFPEEYQFDIILIFNFQLLSGHQEFFQKIYQQLKPGGQLILGCNLVDPDKICSHLPIDQHIQEAFTHPDERVCYPGWLSSGNPDHQYMLRFYTATKTARETDKKRSPIPIPRLTAVEKQINKDNAELRDSFNAKTLKNNQTALTELNRVFEANNQLPSPKKHKNHPRNHNTPTASPSALDFFRQPVATTAVVTSIAGLLMWMVCSSINSSAVETDPNSLGMFGP